jgi:hypothetical protein
MSFEVFEDQRIPGAWRVGAIDPESPGERHVIVFSGMDARQRAQQFAAWNNIHARLGPPPAAEPQVPAGLGFNPKRPLVRFRT